MWKKTVVTGANNLLEIIIITVAGAFILEQL